MSLLFKRVTSADSPLNLLASNLDAINRNQNALVLDLDISGGSIVINLPTIESLILGENNDGAGAMTFYISGTIL